MSAAGARARVRAELTREITDVARRHLASDGAAALSLRAVARELGMASSAVYRYFPSRDDLLTTLIVDAYDAIGEAVERAEEKAGPGLMDRWLAAACAARDWARAHPHEYALLYGSPVPGYAAPQTTIAPAARVAEVLIGIVRDGLADGRITDPGGDDDATLEPGVTERLGLPTEPGSSLGARGVLVWSSLYGSITFELFGQSVGVVADHDAYFTAAMRRLGGELGFT
jgi:AcrR family transcriptional regulator